MHASYSDDDLQLADNDGAPLTGGGNSGGGSSSSPRLGRGVGVMPSLDGDDEEARMLGGGGSNSRAAARPSIGSFRASLVSALVSEALAMYFLVCLGLSAVYSSNLVGDDALSTGSLLMVAIGYGSAYGCIVYCFSLNGGGYVPSIRQLNPALTVALFLMGKLDAVKTGLFTAAQVRQRERGENEPVFCAPLLTAVCLAARSVCHS